MNIHIHAVTPCTSKNISLTLSLSLFRRLHLTSLVKLKDNSKSQKVNLECSQTSERIVSAPKLCQSTFINTLAQSRFHGETHLYCINNFQFNLAPIKNIFSWAGIQSSHCQTKRSNQRSETLKREDKVHEIPQLVYLMGNMILVRLFSNTNIKPFRAY